MRRLFIVAALLIAPSSNAAPKELEWGAYGNNRYNFAICYPPNLKAQGESDNGDGQVFKGGDGSSLTVFGEKLILSPRIDDELDTLVNDAAGPGAIVTYRARKANWIVASGRGPAGEFYLKRLKRGGQA